MIRYLSADYIFPIHQAPLKNGVIAVDENGEVMGIYSKDAAEIEHKNIEYYEGIITPGFVNSHCHLELSHLAGEIPKHTSLIPFLQGVMGRKASEKNLIDVAMQKADQQMYDSGIVAVGDISNSLVSKEVKLKSKIYYHTFVEILGFNPEVAEAALERGKALRLEFKPLHTSIVPHAPYSVSKELFLAIQELSEKENNLFSLHNQESEEENRFYDKKEGGFINFYSAINRSIDFFKAHAQTSLSSISAWLPTQEKILLVHNTFTCQEDIALVKKQKLDITWCLCPNANLYIENTLPSVDLFKESAHSIVLGTDSLASNDKLCILSEIKTLHEHFPDLSLAETLQWATLNGARFLGVDKQLGSIEVGKRPGLNLIINIDNLQINTDSSVIKLI